LDQYKKVNSPILKRFNRFQGFETPQDVELFFSFMKIITKSVQLSAVIFRIIALKSASCLDMAAKGLQLQVFCAEKHGNK
jgi:hypothetical protein